MAKSDQWEEYRRRLPERFSRRECNHLDALYRLADYTAGQIVKAPPGKDMSFSRQDLGALQWAISRLFREASSFLPDE